MDKIEGLSKYIPQDILKEDLAEFVHDQWSGWVKYMFSKGTFNEDGIWIMPKWAVERWMRQMETPYSELSESEKDSDRKEGDKFLEFMGEGIAI